MTKREVLNELAAVVRDTPTPLPRVESGPKALKPAQLYQNSNQTSTSSTSSLFSQLLQSAAGLGSGGAASGTSLLSGLFGGEASAGGGIGGALSLGIAPAVTGLLGLLGFSGKSAPPQLPLYSAPKSINAQAGLQGGALSGADIGQSGLSRGNSTAGQPQVTLHIQAMDTQSILNRSTDIASAVRQAMLQSHPVNDVVADL